MSADQRYAFACSACGKCCNSAPTLTLSELFHHERRFIGCLTLGAAPPVLPAGSRIDGIKVTAAVVEQWQALRQALAVPLGGAWVRVATRAYDYPSLGRCSALADDGRCGVHDDRKPASCGTVPLNAELPDGLQRVVLHRRRADAASFDANCIRVVDVASAASMGSAVSTEDLVWGEHIVHSAYRDAVENQRRHLQRDVDLWGRQVALALAPAWAPALQRRSAGDGHLTLSLVPALAVLASASQAMLLRCQRYAQAQVGLIEAQIQRALCRQHAADRPITAELRRFVAQYRAFLAHAAAAAAFSG